jgi:hypothetical protein
MKTELDTKRQEMRCPSDARRLFGIVLGESIESCNGGTPRVQVSCRECRKLMQTNDPTIIRVYHYYDLRGRFVSTEVVRRSSSAEADSVT